ncbi:flagellar biosynthesis anti-sigma factor FlgM [Kamptonema cortianum]|nr:flagellar biosynthesis anti-sigma factor FlgM [Geitlerinema splendidum]MDK3156861.1 flagellar biosynthesis anti-sigma factor FlgM [Kamptonema cortianum]
MKISTEQIQSILTGDSPSQAKVDEAVIRLTDADLIEEVSAKVAAMPDRDEMVNDLKARIEAGTYNPSGDEIADAMIRRAIADRVK